jgi:uncharacterized protein (TIGR00369 family)
MTEAEAAVPPARSRSYSWDDPAPIALASRELPGLEVLQAMIDGRLPAPPIARTLGIELVEVAPGRAVFEVEPGEHHCNPLGGVHGGLALTLVDSATGCALQTTLPAGVAYTTLETKANLVRTITPETGLVRCTGETLHVGRSTATAEARVVDAAGRLLAHGSSTLIILGR